MPTFNSEVSFGPWASGMYTPDAGPAYRTISPGPWAPGGSSPPPPQPIISISANGWQATHNGTPPAGPLLDRDITGGTAPGFDSNGGATTRALRTGLRVTRRTRVPGSTTLTGNEVALSYKVPKDATIPGVVNNSTATVPRPIVNWIMESGRLRGTDQPPTLEVSVAHYFAGTAVGMVACVEFVINAGQASQLIKRTSAMVVSGRTTDKQPVYSYQITLTNAEWNALPNGIVTYDCNVYPFIGADTGVAATTSVARTSDATARGFPTWKFARRYDVKDPTRAAAIPRCYLSSSGSDITGVWSTDDITARATPFRTLAGALAAGKTSAIPAGAVLPAGSVDGCEIRALAGTFTLAGPATNVPQYGARLIITKAPEVAKSAAIYQHSAAYRLRLGANLQSGAECGFVFRDVTYNRTANVATTIDIFTPTNIEFENTAISMGGFSAALSVGTTRLWFWGDTTFSNVLTQSNSSLFPSGGGIVGIMRGISNNLNGGWIFGYNIAGCVFTNIGQAMPAYATMVPDNLTWNGVNIAGDVATTIFIDATTLGTTIEGLAFVAVVSEWTGTDTNGPIAFRVSADSAVANITHAVTINCTEAGFNDLGRRNWLYTDSVAAKDRLHQWNAIINCAPVQLNTKHDIFGGHTSTTGWEAAYGVGNFSNYVQYLDAGGGSFAIEYYDPNSTPGVSNTTPNNPRFKNPQHTTAGPTAGAGGGNYRPMRISEGDAVDSPLLNNAAFQVLPGFGTTIGAYP